MPNVLDETIMAAARAARDRGWYVANWHEAMEAPYIGTIDSGRPIHGHAECVLEFEAAKVGERLGQPGPAIEVNIRGDNPEEVRAIAMRIVESL